MTQELTRRGGQAKGSISSVYHEFNEFKVMSLSSVIGFSPSERLMGIM